MVAEKRATKIVKDAREQKVERMKQAKVEAGELVEAYRLEKDAAFTSKVSLELNQSQHNV